ncbi:hypothetical protein RRG08_053359 [Elysia crispata]|uniref:Uncharacterized protein n=1 Tax=Elysia crispata TaxID=231223 RepID=A0AAE0ZLQ3_9GAST|nr:hypothetical protein RRG08_053359 [Elysia crispata]
MVLLIQIVQRQPAKALVNRLCNVNLLKLWSTDCATSTCEALVNRLCNVNLRSSGQQIVQRQPAKLWSTDCATSTCEALVNRLCNVNLRSSGFTRTHCTAIGVHIASSTGQAFHIIKSPKFSPPSLLFLLIFSSVKPGQYSVMGNVKVVQQTQK